MAFGQSSGPPATHRQVEELLRLLQDAGHVDFRDARHPLGFTQRQAAGKFTRDEADAFIAQLQEAAEQPGGGEPEGSRAAREPRSAARPKRATGAAADPAPTPRTSTPAAERALRPFSSEQLAAELQRRGWIVVEP